MSDEDRAYYSRRAEEEIGRAQAAVERQVVSFHYQLASLYLDRLYGTDGDPRSHGARDEAA